MNKITKAFFVMPFVGCEKCRIPNDGHPSAYAWNIVIDLIINKLKILN